MSYLKRGFILSALLVLSLGYQNCVPSSPKDFSNSSSKASNQESAPETEGGDGHPYDGKIYVLLGEKCPDQSNIQSKILLKSLSSASLVREKCQDITPVPLVAGDFQLNPSNSEEMTYKSELFTSVKPTQVVGTKLDLSTLESDGGFAYRLGGSFGGPIDINASNDVSTLRLYEDGVLIGPAHAYHWEIRDIGKGFYSHFDDSYGKNRAQFEALRFSASDNTDPRTNGRVYSYDLGGK